MRASRAALSLAASLTIVVRASLAADEPPGVEEPSYPLGPQRYPDLTEPGHPFLLTDVRYRVTDEAALTQDFGARIRIGNWGIFSASVEDQFRAASLTTHRLELGMSEQAGQYAFDAGYRAPRFLLQAAARQRRPGTAWLVDGDLALRLSPEFELLFGASRNTESGGSRNRPLSGWSAGFLYQAGPELNVSGRAVHDRATTDFGPRETSQVSLSATGVLFGSVADALGGYERTTARFPRSEGFMEAGIQAAVLPHLQLLARQGFAWEPSIERFERETRVGVFLHGRRITLTRVGEAARRTHELALRANELGLNLRQAYDLDGRRDLRELLALSSRRDELRDAIDALYRAQVADRNVILASFELIDASHRVRGTSAVTYRASLGAPWPISWPWARDEHFTGFLRVLYNRVRIRYDNGFEQLNQDASLEASLSREMLVAVRWRKPGVSPLDVVRETGRLSTFEVEYSYAFGR
jgi:hypothetical protein